MPASAPSSEDEIRAYVVARRGRPLTLAERNIEIAKLNADLNDGKQKMREAIEAEQLKAIRRWQRNGMRGTPRVRVTPALERILAELYATGEAHAEAELRRAGYRQMAGRVPGKTKAKLKAQLTTYLGGLNTRLARRTTELDLGTVSANAIADALSKVPGALDAASRIISTATYAGLGATFDRVAGQVDATDAPAGGGNGWEYTAVMDGGTCGPCADADGTTYDTWEEAQTDLPDGGPNPDCEGETRCRCRLAIVPL